MRHRERTMNGVRIPAAKVSTLLQLRVLHMRDDRVVGGTPSVYSIHDPWRTPKRAQRGGCFMNSALQHPADGPDVRPIRRVPLHDQVTITLRDMIIAGSLKPGSHLIEGDLGALLGVSRTPLRESLKTLASEGLVDLVPARGAFVKHLTADGAQSMLEVITGLEAFAGRLACQRASDADIAELRTRHAELETQFAARDRTRYVKANIAIHAGIVALSANPELIATHTHYSMRSRRVRFAGTVSDAAWLAAMVEHREMMSALAARDADRLARVLRNHIGLVWDRIRSNF